jgi:TonB family protein
LKNVADVAVTSVDVIAFVGGRPAAVPPQARGVQVDVLIEPGNSTTVALHLLDRPQLAEMRSAIGEPRQAFIGLTSVRFANGAQWTATPNAAGRTLEEIFGLPPAQVARQLVGVPSESNWLCYDQDRGEYSPGAVVPVRDEPGRYVECDKGLWRDYDLASTQEQRASESTNGFTVNLSGASLDEILNAVGSATGMTITRAPGVPNTTGLNLRLQRARTEELLDVLRIALPPELECRWVDSRTIVVEPRDARPAEPPTQKDTEPPRALKQVRPEYPRALVAQAIEGNVLVAITVGADGKVKDAIVTKSLSRDLDAEALKAAKQWVFKPGTKDGVPVEVKTELEFTFEVR